MATCYAMFETLTGLLVGADGHWESDKAAAEADMPKRFCHKMSLKWEPQQSLPKKSPLLSESGTSREEVNQALIVSQWFQKKYPVTLQMWAI